MLQSHTDKLISTVLNKNLGMPILLNSYYVGISIETIFDADIS